MIDSILTDAISGNESQRIDKGWINIGLCIDGHSFKGDTCTTCTTT